MLGGGGAGGGGEGEQSCLQICRHLRLMFCGVGVMYVFHQTCVYRPSPSGPVSERVKQPGKNGSLVPPHELVPGGLLYACTLRGCTESSFMPTLRSRAASSHSSRVVISCPAGQIDVVLCPQRTEAST